MWPNYPYGEIRFYNQNYGDTYSGFAVPFNGWTPCVTTANFELTENGNCDTWSAKADNASLHINAYFYDARVTYTNGLYIDDMVPRVLRHELGHAIGMGHYLTASASFMGNPISSSQPLMLLTDEVSWINYVY
ncbi:MAG: hypothetical protein RLZZ227_103 [Pseudomonadota bacterium]|jgi:hypothetical protein